MLSTANQAVHRQTLDAPRKASSIDSAFKELEDELAALGSFVDDLVTRIEPVLRPGGPTSTQANNAEQHRPVSCQLDNAIATRVGTIVRIRKKLAEALERVEL